MNNKAIEDFSVAIKYNPKKITYLLDRAQVYYENGNYDASNADYQQAYNLDNTWLSAAVGLARNLIAQKEYEKAIMSLSKLTKLQDNYGQIYRFTGDANKKGRLHHRKPPFACLLSSCNCLLLFTWFCV